MLSNSVASLNTLTVEPSLVSSAELGGVLEQCQVLVTIDVSSWLPYWLREGYSLNKQLPERRNQIVNSTLALLWIVFFFLLTVSSSFFRVFSTQFLRFVSLTHRISPRHWKALRGAVVSKQKHKKFSASFIDKTLKWEQRFELCCDFYFQLFWPTTGFMKFAFSTGELIE